MLGRAAATRAPTDASSGEHLVLLGLREEHRPHFLDFLRVLRGDVLGLAEVRFQVVELEYLVVQRIRVGRTEGIPWHAIDLGAHQPAVMVNRPLAHHLEVLGLVPRRRLGVVRVEGVGEARALDRLLLYAVDVFGRARCR